ncbi:MAG: HupE/UreJ family protein [Bryobacteraceae bacterium]
MSCWNRVALGLVLCAVAQGHVVSISNGELRVTGRSATFELRIPAYEVESIASPETTLLNELRFGDATRTSSECKKDVDWLTCHATYQFAQPVPDKIEVECTLYRVSVPNHIHMLYAVQGENSDQRVFDQNTSIRELRFHPPSFWESITRDGSAGVLRLLTSPAGVLFLFVIALAARSARDVVILGAMFLAAEWAVRPISPFIPLALSPEFLEALMALTVAYLAGELLFLPDSSAKWVIVPVLGLVHGLPFVAFPPLYLAGATLAQALLLAGIAAAVLRVPASWRKPATATLLIAAGGWFARLVFA